MEIRLAVPADADALCALYEIFFDQNAAEQPEYYRPVQYPTSASDYGAYPKSVIASESADFLVAVQDSEVIGFIHVSEDKTSPYASIVPHRFAHVVDFVVRPDRRNCGVGALLLEHAKQWAQARNLDYLELFVLKQNENAHRFYRAHEFGDVSTTMRCPL